MDQLQGQPGLDAFAGGAAPTDQQVPSSQAQVFGDQQPQPQHGTADLVGQELPDATLQTLGITRLGVNFSLGTLRLHSLFRARVATMKFFFEGRSG
jgi:hypothetical protein